jgi:hypothetical protein
MVSNNKTIRVVALLVGVAMACAMVGLHAQEGDQFAKPMKVDYKNPGINFSQYDSLLINDLDVSNTKIVPPPWKADKPFKWEVSAKNVTALQAAFRESMHDQISANDGYPIVTEPGPGVMEISVRIVSFMPYADRKEEVTTRGSGEMRIHVETRDAQSEELIAIYEGPQEVGQDYGPNSDFARQENLKALFDFWGQRIRIAMDKGRN